MALPVAQYFLRKLQAIQQMACQWALASDTIYTYTHIWYFLVMHCMSEIRHLDSLLQHQRVDKLRIDSLVKGAGVVSACMQQYSVTQPKCRC